MLRNKRGRRNAMFVAVLTAMVFLLLIMTKKPVNSRMVINPQGFAVDINVTDKQLQRTTVSPADLVFFFNYANCYPCPFYTDRADLIAPEINRLAQFMRAYGSKIILASNTDKKTHYTANLVEADTDNHLSETSPKFVDKCLFSDYNQRPATCNGSIHHDIMYSTKRDYFVRRELDAVGVAKDLGAKFLVVGGMRCNLWMLPVFASAKANGIQPIYLYDLSDVAYFRETQLSELDTQVAALKKFWTYVMKEYGMILNHFELLDRPYPSSPAIPYDGNIDAYYFKDFYKQ